MIINKFKEYKADFLLFTVAIAWGLTFLIVQDAIKNVEVFSFLFWRFSLSCVIMFAISYKYFDQINKESVFYGCALGIVLFAGFSTQTFGLLYVKSSIVAFITGFNVILVPFLALLFFKQKISKNVFLASLIALIGLYFLTMSGELKFAYGEILVLICALMFALHIVLTGQFSRKGNVFIIVCFQFLTVSVLSLIFSLSLEEVTFNVNFDYVFIKAVVITAIFATVYAFLIQTYMQQYTSASKTAIIFTMEPVSAALFGVYVGNEFLSSYQIFGAVLIILATLLAELKWKKKEEVVF
ncbi:MAG: DMT family transporter [Campylobacteraceae bacterium]|nr:DMT family transporter [Campylobacteraceae bacterium]